MYSELLIEEQRWLQAAAPQQSKGALPLTSPRAELGTKYMYLVFTIIFKMHVDTLHYGVLAVYVLAMDFVSIFGLHSVTDTQE